MEYAAKGDVKHASEYANLTFRCAEAHGITPPEHPGLRNENNKQFTQLYLIVRNAQWVAYERAIKKEAAECIGGVLKHYRSSNLRLNPDGIYACLERIKELFLDYLHTATKPAQQECDTDD